MWFALHFWFARFAPARLGPFQLSLPDPTSLDPAAAVLSLVAAVALLRLKLGLIPVLVGSAALGGVHRLAF